MNWRTGRHELRDPEPIRSLWRPAPEPGVLARRPQRFFEGLDGGFRLLRFAPALTVGLALIVFTLWALALAALGSAVVWASAGLLAEVFADPDATAGFAVITQVGALVASLTALSLVHLLAGVTAVGTRAAFDSERMTLKQGWAALRGVRLRLVLTTVLLFALHLGALIALSAPALLLAGLGSGTGSAIVLLLGVFGWLAFTVYFGIRTAFVGCVISHEQATVGQAFRRSWRLTRHGFWRTAGQLVLGYALSNQLVSIVITPIIIIVYVALIIVSLTMLSTASVTAFGAIALTLVALVTVFVTLAATAALFAYLAGLVSVVYFDRLMRTEGYDLILLREAERRAAR
ncbi:hypothetical protein GCM10022261_26640 [Brevibacterium daeguense]|uniref:Glycerophosphoryl diester phosphodiesterase membrane domain-containing protein n=2 Tax=Brevibacterium daeguense TaxID=909936 RepID=A0ABP8EN24_9MICO